MKCTRLLFNFIVYRREAFVFSYSKNDRCTSSKYKFNLIEKIGNRLLDLQGYIIDEWDETESLIVKIALVFATILFSVITLFGLIFKKIGEGINPVGHLRSQAIEIKSKIFYLILDLQDFIIKRHHFSAESPHFYTFKRLYLDKVLKDKFKATEDDLIASCYYKSFVRKNPTSISSAHPHLSQMKLMNERWTQAWDEYFESVHCERIPSHRVKEAILDIAQQNEELLINVAEFFKTEEDHIHKKKELRNLQKKFLSLQLQLTHTSQVRNLARGRIYSQ